jgi:CHAT domain-containing protein
MTLVLLGAGMLPAIAQSTNPNYPTQPTQPTQPIRPTQPPSERPIKPPTPRPPDPETDGIAPPIGSPVSPLPIDQPTGGGVLSIDLSCRAAVGTVAQKTAACESLLAQQRLIGDRLGEWQTLRDLGQLMTEQNRLAMATIFYRQAIQLEAGLGNRVQIGDLVRRSLADVLLRQGRLREGIQAIDLMHLQEVSLHSSTRFTTAMLPVALPAPEAAIATQHSTVIGLGQRVDACKQSRCAELSQLNDQLQKLLEEYNKAVQAHEAELRERRGQDDGFFDPTKLAKIREIVDAQPGTVLIYPLVLADRLWLVWAAPGGVVSSVQVPVTSQQLGETVVRFRELIQDPSETRAFQAVSQQLYGWLIKPLEAELKANRVEHLVFALDRVLRYAPMSALFDGQQYLIERYTVAGVLTADLTNLRDRLPSKPADTPVLAMGASEFTNFNALPHVPRELDAIVRQPSDQRGIYPGREFLNQMFDFRTLRDNLFGHKIVHLATHGAFVSGKAEQSYLVLGNSEKLAIPQVKTLTDLSGVHLVVLSACETALGQPNQDGIEISGVNFYFLNAGTAAVLASLWAVNDASTSTLMQQFYAELANAQGRLTKAEALRRAQLSLLHGGSVGTAVERGLGVVAAPRDRASSAPQSPFARPFHWAPFVLMGNSL